MYRIYAHQKNKGWVIVDVKKDKEEAIEVANSLNPKDYYSSLVVQADENGEKVIQRKDLTREEFVKKLKVNVNDEPIKTYKQSKMKQKEDLRKHSQNYTSSKDFGEDDYLNF